MCDLEIPAVQLKKLSLQELEDALKETNETVEKLQYQLYYNQTYKHADDGTDWGKYTRDKYYGDVPEDSRYLSKFTSRSMRLEKEIKIKQAELKRQQEKQEFMEKYESLVEEECMLALSSDAPTFEFVSKQVDEMKKYIKKRGWKL
jgi:hypothetical protein